MADLPQPKYRKERYLYNIASGTTSELPQPKSREERYLYEIANNGGGGEGGTTNYNQLSNKPQVNGVELSGNKTTEDLIPIGDGLDFDEDGKLVTTGGSGGDSSLTKDVTTNLAVGAIASGTTLERGTTFTQFVEKLVVSEIAPTISMSMTKSGNVQYGESYDETLSVNVSALGTAKSIDTIAWYKGDTLLHTDTIESTTTGTWTYTVADAVTDNATFKAIVTYKKSDNTNGTSTKTVSIAFYYPKFRGVVDSLTPSEAIVEALTSALATGKGGTYSFTANAQRIAYAYPSSLGALTSIKDGNGFSLFDSFNRTTESYTVAGQTVNYYLYVLTDATTVDNYSVIFA